MILKDQILFSSLFSSCGFTSWFKICWYFRHYIFFPASKKNGGGRVNAAFKFAHNTYLEIAYNAYSYFSMGDKFFSWSFISKHKERLRM